MVAVISTLTITSTITADWQPHEGNTISRLETTSRHNDSVSNIVKWWKIIRRLGFISPE